MLGQFEIPLEIQFLLYSTLMLLGIQVSLYITIRYVKIRNEKLRMNNVLLGMATFLISAYSASFLLIINRLYSLDPAIEEIFYRIAYGLMITFPVVFIYIVNLPDFQRILNRRTVRLLMALSFVPVVLLVLGPSTSWLIFRASLIFTVFDALYIAIFQFRLIRMSIGEIKKRLQLVIFGEILSLLGMSLASEIVLGYFASLPGWHLFIPFAIVSGILLLIVGMLIILVAFYNFPENAFYELEWRNTIVKLLVIDTRTNTCLYSCDFGDLLKQERPTSVRETSAAGESDAFLSGGLMGIESLISEITGTKKEKINKIKYGDFFIYLEPGSTSPIPIMFALVVKKDLDSARYALSSISKQFESFYKDMLSNMNRIQGSAEKIFKSFDIMARSIIA